MSALLTLYSLNARASLNHMLEVGPHFTVEQRLYAVRSGK